MAAMASSRGGEEEVPSALYCSTSGTYFADKESLADHYRSEFHRYNLKRKVAGLPPVTQDWFEARKAQLLSVSKQSEVAASVQKTWVCPLSRKKFNSLKTYEAHTRSKKYKELVKKNGGVAPAPTLVERAVETPEAKLARLEAENAAQAAEPSFAAAARKQSGAGALRKVDEDAAASDDGSDDEWETDDDEAMADGGDHVATASGNADVDDLADEVDEILDASKWEEWDVCTSLFDNHVSESFEANCTYMYKRFGFYFPEADYLRDPEGLLKYLGAKLRYGRVPLYARGDDPNAKRFRTLHAVQRHMVDRGRCKLAYDDNEDEYADYYDWPDEDEDPEYDARLALAADQAQFSALSGMELTIAGEGGGGTRVLGTREFSRYYRQKFRPVDTRQSVAVNKVVSQYRLLGLEAWNEEQKETQKQQHAQSRRRRKMARVQDRMDLKYDKINNLPKNCTY